MRWYASYGGEWRARQQNCCLFHSVYPRLSSENQPAIGHNAASTNHDTNFLTCGRANADTDTGVSDQDWQCTFMAHDVSQSLLPHQLGGKEIRNSVRLIQLPAMFWLRVSTLHGTL